MRVEVHIVTPEREVWTGEVEELIARGVDGEVGILGGHAPLLVQLAIGPLRMLQPTAARSRAVVDGGFLHVSSHEGVTRADVLAVARGAGRARSTSRRRAAGSRSGRTARPRTTTRSRRREIAKAIARIKLAG